MIHQLMTAPRILLMSWAKQLCNRGHNSLINILVTVTVKTNPVAWHHNTSSPPVPPSLSANCWNKKECWYFQCWGLLSTFQLCYLLGELWWYPNSFLHNLHIAVLLSRFPPGSCWKQIFFHPVSVSSVVFRVVFCASLLQVYW